MIGGESMTNDRTAWIGPANLDSGDTKNYRKKRFHYSANLISLKDVQDMNMFSISRSTEYSPEEVSSGDESLFETLFTA